MDPNATIPPVGARTPRNLLRWLLAWAAALPIEVKWGAAGVIVGLLLPKVAQWVF